MDTRHFKLTEDARRALEQVELERKDLEERRHMQAVRLFGTGDARVTIFQVVQVSERTIERWVKRYTGGGLVALARRAQRGSHRSLRQAEWGAVVNVLKNATPVSFGLSERQP